MLQRVRYALLVAVVAGSVLNLWSTFDSVSRVPSYDAMLKAGYQIGPTPNPLDALRTPSTPSTSIDWTLIAKEQKQAAEREYYRPRVFPYWERATKIEFAVLAVALCVWLLLPRSKSGVAK
jgi:hypothetical protein